MQKKKKKKKPQKTEFQVSLKGRAVLKRTFPQTRPKLILRKVLGSRAYRVWWAFKGRSVQGLTDFRVHSCGHGSRAVVHPLV